MTPRPLLTRLRSRLSFYEWAYGHLAEGDADLGPIAEFLVGSALGCLPPSRTLNAPYDLVLSDGRTIEVKATAKRAMQSGGRPPVYRWNVGTQFAGSKRLADLWFFFIADFPATAARQARFDVFDPRHWRVRVATGEQLASTGVTRYVYERTLDRLSIPVQSFAAFLRSTRSRGSL